MSKMDPAEMGQMEVEFIQGCQRPPPAGPGFTSEQARRLWEQVVVFSGYGFNRGHATAYADVSYRMAYVKAHWPAAFFCARLANRGGYHHPAMYVTEAIRLGIRVRPPHVNHSENHFTLTWEGDRAVLWMGLGQVRDLRRRAVRAIVAERRRQPFADVRDLIGRVSLRSKEVTHLIRCGALDRLGEHRQALLAEAEEIVRAGSALQMALFDDRAWGQPEPESAPESWRQRLEWEKHLLGYPVSALADPLQVVRDRLPAYVPLCRLSEAVRRTVTVAGVRLPGWSREDFYLWDGETWIVVRVAKGDRSQKRPPAWEPALIRGRWVGDEWGACWLQAEQVQIVRPG
jgi:DNA polymerase III alpha subunit